MDIARVIRSACFTLTRSKVYSPGYLVQLTSMSQPKVAEAAFGALRSEILTGELSPGRLWYHSPEVTIKVIEAIGLKTPKVWNEKAVDAELSQLAQASRDPKILGLLCLNQNSAKGEPAIGLLAALNPNTSWQDTLGVLVRLPRERADIIYPPEHRFAQRANIAMHGGTYGTETAVMVEKILNAHGYNNAAKIMKALESRNFKLWFCMQDYFKDAPTSPAAG